MNTGRILQIISDVSMANSHDGLTAIAKKHGLDTKNIEVGTYLVFINSKKDKMKIYAASETIAYVRLARGRHIDLRVIAEIPRVFTGRRVNYDQALELMINKRLSEKPVTHSQPHPLMN